MKAFEEWRDKQYDGCQECSASPPGTEWRAALEWLHKEVKRLNGEEGYHLIDVFKLDKVIRQELEDSE